MEKQRSIDILAIGGIDLDLVMTVPHVPGPDEKALGEFVGRLPGDRWPTLLVLPAAWG